MRRWFSILLTATAVLGFHIAGPAPVAGAAETAIGRIGDTLRVDNNGVVADVTVLAPVLSEIPPGFGYPPRSPRQQVWKSQVVVQAKQVPNPYAMAVSFWFRGVTPTGDAYEPRNSDAPDALQFGLQNAPQGSTVTGWVYWDCYRDLVTNVVLVNKKTGTRLAQWNM
ncbi:hypothetical protein [Mycolicibacterium mengxianglii]|uniref:hypothetical protein n=1 Tax=Mycolicibacterium mengxianglii TaxID=2736649 RepID=UPI0018D0B4CC|nr:hypothetical protein [Mycolicibacterium mengxianglii]